MARWTFTPPRPATLVDAPVVRLSATLRGSNAERSWPEMLHLALVANLMSAIGAAPTFTRPNFPQRSGYFPPTRRGGRGRRGGDGTRRQARWPGCLTPPASPSVTAARR
ncbi:MAG TPA: ferritin-like domain-containing protein [Mycobacteriales bacterium]|nr:ferritin-like domain-containing protein [Mycobacteriales bacterium]